MKKKWPDAEGRRLYKDLQKRLYKKLLKTENIKVNTVRKLLALDVSYREGYAFVCGVLWDIPKACPLSIYIYSEKIQYPYISGLFFVRELPPIVHLLKNIKVKYDILLLNAVGSAHPEGIGLATHAGLYIKKPSFGITERIPYGLYSNPDIKERTWTEIFDVKGSILGYVLRSQKYVKPIFVTPGFRLNAQTALYITLLLPFNSRFPEPLRLADKCSKKKLEKEIKIRGCEDKTIYPIQYSPMSWK